MIFTFKNGKYTFPSSHVDMKMVTKKPESSLYKYRLVIIEKIHIGHAQDIKY
jgi:hypothetical protein